MDALWIVALVLIALWAVGLMTKMAGRIVHLLLVIAVVVILYHLVSAPA